MRRSITSKLHRLHQRINQPKAVNNNQIQSDLSQDFNARTVKLAVAGSSGSSADSTVEDTDSNFKANAEKGWSYYNTYERVSDAIKYHIALALGEDTYISCKDENTQKDANEFAVTHNIHSHVYEQIEQLLVKGECCTFRHVTDNQLTRLQTVNPVSLTVEYIDGELSKLVQGEKPFDLDNLLHLKWNSPSYNNRGLTSVFIAFKALERLDSLETTDKFIEQKYREPLRHCKIGAERAKKYYRPNKRSIESVASAIKKLKPGEFLITDDLVSLDTDSGDAKVPDNSKKYARLDERISIAMQMPRPLATGDGPNHATAKAAVEKERVQVGKIRKASKKLWAFAMQPFILQNGVSDELTYGRVDTDPSVDIDVIKTFVEAYKVGACSRETLQLAMKLSPEIEFERLANEKKSLNAAQLHLLVNDDIITKNEARAVLNLDKTDTVETDTVEATDNSTDDNDNKDLSAADTLDIVKLYARCNIPMLATTGNEPCSCGSCESHSHNHKHANPVKTGTVKTGTVKTGTVKTGTVKLAGNIASIDELKSIYEPNQADYEQGIKKASGRVQAELERLKELDEKTEGQISRLQILDGLKDNLDKIEKDLTADLASVASGSVEVSVKAGVQAGVADLNTYEQFTIGKKAVAEIFSSVDDHALEYLKTSQLKLAGSVSQELMSSIHQEIVAGVASGDSLEKVIKNIGGYIEDEEAFKQAGKTYFKTAQKRIRVIARTETMRAYNEGTKLSYKEMGVTQVKWIVTNGCPICEVYSGQEFDIDEMPDLPLHPNCTCTIVAVIDMEGLE